MNIKNIHIKRTDISNVFIVVLVALFLLDKPDYFIIIILLFADNTSWKILNMTYTRPFCRRYHWYRNRNSNLKTKAKKFVSKSDKLYIFLIDTMKVHLMGIS